MKNILLILSSVLLFIFSNAYTATEDSQPLSKEAKVKQADSVGNNVSRNSLRKKLNLRANENNRSFKRQGGNFGQEQSQNQLRKFLRKRNNNFYEKQERSSLFQNKGNKKSSEQQIKNKSRRVLRKR